MTNQKKAILLAILLVVIIAAAFVGYRSLSSVYREREAVQAETGGSLEQERNAVASGQEEGQSAAYEAAQKGADDTLAPAADFSMKDADGKTVRLSDHFGKPVILNFWATWCPPCREEMPFFDAACREYGDQIDFLFINATDGQRDTAESAAAFIRDNGYSLPLYCDTAGEGMQAYGVMYIPTTVCITSEGNVYAIRNGGMDQDELNRLIQNFLACP